jgi:hypothetical protein
MIKNSYLSFFLVLSTSLGYAQVAAIKTDLPNISPPSPTVASLMKFEEIPVNNYTGVPDISIPLYSVQSKSPDIALNLSLNYHPASIAVREVASYVGLGWNLMAGGTVSRTVRGLPDEIDDMEDGYHPQRRGIYSFQNPYYTINGIRTSWDNNIDRYNASVKQFFWESVEKGWYDSEHDLYQYNFMGHSGRFYVKRVNGSYKTINLDNNNNLVITPSINTINNKIYLSQFTIKDEKGYIYTFDVIETTNVNTRTTVNYFGDMGGPPSLNPSNIEYKSAFHLSKIEDNALNILMLFNYNPSVFIEKDKDYITTTNQLKGITVSDLQMLFTSQCNTNPNQFPNIEPESSLTIQTRTTETKKLSSIDIPNKARIYFGLIGDREDSENINGCRLQNLIVKDWNYNQIKKFDFSMIYTEYKEDNKRMLLEKVVESNFIDQEAQTYSLEYATGNLSLEDKIGEDHWGYYNIAPPFYIGPAYRETSPTHCRIDVLEKMILPTGGAIGYDFQSNEYSYDGDIRLEDFSANPNRFIETMNSYGNFPSFGTVIGNIYGGSGFEPLFKIQDKQTVRFTGYGDGNTNFVMYVHTGPSLSSSSFTAFNGNSTSIGSGGGYIGATELETGWYFPRVQSFQGGNPSSFGITAFYKIRHPERYYDKSLLGGGVRINSISYFDKVSDLEPVRKKVYDYSFFNEPKRSSGSLAFPKPVINIVTTKRHAIRARQGDCDGWQWFNPEIYSYDTHTSFNNLKALKTQGSDVGYKNVTVYETGNGKSQYTYTSPIDFPEIDYESTDAGNILRFPFKPSKNFDYKRGILKNEKHLDNYSRALAETVYEHDIIETIAQTGINIYAPLGSCRVFDPLIGFSGYMARFNNCDGQTADENFNQECYHCGDPSQYIEYYDIEEYSGWVQLKTKTAKNYFYDKNNAKSTVSVKETFEYNPLNKQLSSYSKDIYNSFLGASEKIKEDYYYLYNSTVLAQNDLSKISQIDKFNNNELISRQKVNFANSLSTGNPDYLPESISTSREAGSPEIVKLRFVKYDVFGSPLEAKRENGISVVYIYDCNHHSPIAVIENATYNQVVSLLGTPINPAGYSEADMAALNNLRNTLPNANISTYTYIPLVGVSTITDQRGYMMKYYYDGFGRLKQVKDHEDKIVSENVYKYSTQN